jgi:hypothetical protein
MKPLRKLIARRRGEERSLAGRAFRPADAVTTASGEGQATVLDLERQRYYGLDEVGATIWAMVHERLTFEQIVDRLSDQYDAPRAQLEADASRFLNGLRDRRLVEDA